jgi:signal recognition particle receptor subunit beta
MTILLAGASSSGKTTSLRNLDHTSTIYISVDNASPAFPGAKKKYNTANKNLFHLRDFNSVKAYIDNINKAAPHIKTIVVDTITSLAEYTLMDLKKKPGFDKFKGMAEDMFDLIQFCNSVRDDLNIILVSHTETVKSTNPETGEEQLIQELAVPGQLVNKMKLTKYLSYCLLAYIDTEIGTTPETIGDRYRIRTNGNGHDFVRSPMGCLDYSVPNDMKVILEKIEEYENRELA